MSDKSKENTPLWGIPSMVTFLHRIMTKIVHDEDDDENQAHLASHTSIQKYLNNEDTLKDLESI